jgi:hypothetical protein
MPFSSGSSGSATPSSSSSSAHTITISGTSPSPEAVHNFVCDFITAQAEAEAPGSG